MGTQEIELLAFDCFRVNLHSHYKLDEGRATPQELQAWLVDILADIPGRFRFLRWGCATSSMVLQRCSCASMT